MQGLQFLVEFITALSSSVNKQYCDFPRAECCVETLLRLFPTDISFCCWHETCFHDLYPCGEERGNPSSVHILIYLLVLIFVNSHAEFLQGEGTKVWNLSQSCLAGVVPVVAMHQSCKVRWHFVVCVWEQTCSNWRKAEKRDVICQICENSVWWSCFRNLFITTCWYCESSRIVPLQWSVSLLTSLCSEGKRDWLYSAHETKSRLNLMRNAYV